MRTRGRMLGVAVVMTLALATGGVSQLAMAADDTGTPSQQDVEHAQAAARAKATDVETVQAQLAVANQRLQESAIAAQQAAEEYNGARYRLQQARRAARAAEDQSERAARTVARQRNAYADAMVTSYELSPGLNALSAITQSDGIRTVIDTTTTLGNAEDALNDQYDEYRAAATVAGVASDQAAQARTAADRAEEESRAARDRARAAEQAAAADAQAIAEEKTQLIGELARLQNVSVELAQQRQSALEAQAAAAAAEAAQHEQELLEQQQQQEQQQQEQQQQQQQQDADQGSGSTGPSTTHPPTPTPTPTPTPAPTPTPPPAPTPSPPPPSGGASAAVGFARAQLGEPYRWAAAGPDAWDCSGLTMGAWRAGGISLPHYSVAQYQQSTPISPGALQPGDLVFWGSSSNPSSIYHVALYVGGGRIIHAPRTGRPVTEESMYYWITPNFYARP